MSTSPQLGPRFEEALIFATRLHAHQLRKGTRIPYVAHLLSVASLVLEDGGSETEAIAALLHDAIEDQGGKETRDEILKRFGPEVTAIVEGCSDADVQPKPPWKARKERYLDHLRHASLSSVRVSLADKVHNLRAIVGDFRQLGPKLWERFSVGPSEQLWYYQSFVDVMKTRTSSPLVGELERLLGELRTMAQAL